MAFRSAFTLVVLEGPRDQRSEVFGVGARGRLGARGLVRPLLRNGLADRRHAPVLEADLDVVVEEVAIPLPGGVAAGRRPDAVRHVEVARARDDGGVPDATRRERRSGPRAAEHRRAVDDDVADPRVVEQPFDPGVGRVRALGQPHAGRTAAEQAGVLDRAELHLGARQSRLTDEREVRMRRRPADDFDRAAPRQRLERGRDAAVRQRVQPVALRAREARVVRREVAELVPEHPFVVRRLAQRAQLVLTKEPLELAQHVRVFHLVRDHRRQADRHRVFEPIAGERLEDAEQRQVRLDRRLMEELLADRPHPVPPDVRKMGVQDEREDAHVLPARDGDEVEAPLEPLPSALSPDGEIGRAHG